jgi:hypothetical protein
VKPPAHLVMRDGVAAWLWDKCKCTKSTMSVIVSMVVVGQEDVVLSVLGS